MQRQQRGDFTTENRTILLAGPFERSVFEKDTWLAERGIGLPWSVSGLRQPQNVTDLPQAVRVPIPIPARSKHHLIRRIVIRHWNNSYEQRRRHVHRRYPRGS
jgi:hypothetical protein